MRNGGESGSKPIVVFGATSDVAIALSRRYAQEGASLILVGRNESRLTAVADDLRVRGALHVRTLLQDSLTYDDHPTLVESLFTDHAPAKFYFFQGSLPDQAACEASFEVTREAVEVNFLSIVSYLTWLASALERRPGEKGAAGGASIIVVSSVAGDRGRGSNYVYGASKGGLTIFLQGLRNRLHKSNHGVLTVKPGFIDTKMTADIEKGGPLWAKPEKVADDIRLAADGGRMVLYTPWFWQFIMLVIKSIPEGIFKRLSL
ncbi:SDR family oxidoreductase [Allohahella marinimesophila]|uniref:SDR family oxidoreductase n=2 Tax=Allohahella marinimesophila TaxID=1054972 RepID=A0ABP7QCM7_9GAMM